jgi:uncharacterized protein
VPKRIAIDIDSTLHHYWDQLRAVVLRRHGVDLPYERQTDWHVSVLPAEDLSAAVLETHGADLVLAAEPYPGAVETVQAWHDAGHYVHITSHRPVEAHDHTAQWLDRIGLAYDDLYCSYDKISRCVELGIDVLIDDSPTNMRRAHERGILAATLRHPWNADLCAEQGFLCAEDWPELRKALEPVLSG